MRNNSPPTGNQSSHLCSTTGEQPNLASSGNAWNDGLTRRRFLKRSGAATAATFIAWHGLSLDAKASIPKPAFSNRITIKVCVEITVDTPTPEELNDANRRVREIIASSNLTGAAKVLFARTSMDIIDEMTVEANKKGSLFFNIPLDETRDIFIDRSRDHKSIDALAKELKESNGMDAQSLGSGAGEIRMISRTKEGWRYEKFLMLEEQNK